MIKKPCPFCQNPNAPEGDSGGACCFCDYEGVVTIGVDGMFTNEDQYNKIFFASSHKDRMDKLHGRDNDRGIDMILSNTFDAIDDGHVSRS